MKLAMCFLFAASSASAQFMPEQISMIMSATKLQENRAERHQAKMVEKIRESVEKRIRDQAGVITEEFDEYVAETRAAENVLEAAVNASAKALKAEEAGRKPGGWDRKAAMDRGRLGEEVKSAKQVLMHEQHQHKQALRKAEHAAEDVIGGEVDKLGRKLGDMDAVAREIDAQLVEHIRVATEQVLRDNQTFTSPQADYSPAGPTYLSEVNQDLGKAEAASAARAEGAEKHLKDFLARVSGEVATMGDKALSDLAHKQKEEISKVFGHPSAAAAAPAKKPSKEAPAAKAQQPKAQQPKAPVQASVKGPARK